MSKKTAAPSPAAPVALTYDRLPETDLELWWTVYQLFGYKIPTVAVCPGHVAPFRAFADAFFARYTTMIWKASRGLGGKSRTLAILSLTEAVLYACEVRLLGGSSAQSKNILDATLTAWDHPLSPKQLLDGHPLRDKTVLLNGGNLVTLTASETSVRGPHPARLRMDEIDVMKQSILDSALGMPMEQRNRRGELIIDQTVMSSTHQVPDGVMTEMIKRAREQNEAAGQTVYPVYEWCMQESANPWDGWLTQRMIDSARSRVSAHMWATEFELQEPSVEGRVLDANVSALVFALGYNDNPQNGEWTDTGIWVPSGTQADTGEVEYTKDFTTGPYIYEDKQPGLTYVTGVDWATEKDLTVVATFAVLDDKFRCVAWQCFNKVTHPVAARRAVEQWRLYGGDFVHDKTGAGIAVDGILQEILTRAEYARVEGVTFTRTNKHAMLYDYVRGMESGEVMYPRIVECYDEHRYATNDDLFGSGHTPDSIIAGALAFSRQNKGTAKNAPVGAQGVAAIMTGGTNVWGSV